MFAGPHHRCDWRSLEPSDLAECFLRTRRFEGFQSALGITRHLLAERLKKLVRQGVLRRIPYQESPKRHEYILTQKGLDLYPVMMALVHWGDTHMVDERGRPLLHEHRKCGKTFDHRDDMLRMRRTAAGQRSPYPPRSRRTLGFCKAATSRQAGETEDAQASGGLKNVSRAACRAATADRTVISASSLRRPHG